MSQKRWNIGLVSLISLLGAAVVASAQGHRGGFGLQYDAMSGDADNGMGAYGLYEVSLRGPLAVMAEVSYVTGDFDVGEDGSGSYSSIGLGAALVFHFEVDNWYPYFGAGGARQFNDFDRINYDDELSMFFLAGMRWDVGEQWKADVGIRYRTLRVEHPYEPDITKIDMDAVVLRLGLVREF